MKDIFKDLAELEKQLQTKIYALNPHNDLSRLTRMSLEFQLEQVKLLTRIAYRLEGLL